MSQTTADSTHHLTVDIDNMLHSFSSAPSKPSMFRVDDYLSGINRKDYDPEIIAIGPLHRGDEKLHNMKQHKVRYLKRLLEREKKSVETFVTAIRELEDEARKCYPEDMMEAISEDEFVQMLILDGCFIIEFLRNFTKDVRREEDDPIFQYGYIKNHVLHDLIVFENQIPFSIIKCLFKTFSSEEDMEILIRSWLKIWIFPKQNLPEFKIGCQHLLGILHDVHRPSLLSPPRDLKEENINSAVDLEKAGISFKKLEMKNTNSDAEPKKVMFHIEYGNKVMKIPEWKISDSTESLFRNLMAYEYYLPDPSQRYVTDYVYLMSCLVHSSEDAKLLRLRGIISNLLGSDKMVYEVINKLNKNVIISVKFSYSEIFSQVSSDCKGNWNEWMAMLRRKYFNSPWAIISLIAAILLLVLAIIQTVLAILSFLSSSLEDGLMEVEAVKDVW